MAEVVREQTGRRLVGTDGGLYLFSESEIRLPYGSVEGAVHELCHWVVASEEERKLPNMGLSTDWQHPKFDRMVRCEELAWSLEFYLYGDPTAEIMARYLTPEARASGGGVNIGYTNHSQFTPRQRWEGVQQPTLEEAAKAEMERGKRLVEQEAEKLRREALRKAEEAGLRVRDLKAIIQAAKDAHKAIPELERELRALEGPESPHCTAEKDGFTCDRMGNHAEHAAEDVRGKVIFAWRDLGPTAEAQLAQRMRNVGRDLAKAQTQEYVRNALVDLSVNRPGLALDPPVKKECSRCHHIHRGETRETSADQCGYPCRTEAKDLRGRMMTDSDYWWCQCYGDDE